MSSSIVPSARKIDCRASAIRYPVLAVRVPLFPSHRCSSLASVVVAFASVFVCRSGHGTLGFVFVCALGFGTQFLSFYHNCESTPPLLISINQESELTTDGERRVLE